MNRYVLDGCTFAEGEFEGCSQEVLKSAVDAFFLTVPNSEKGFKAGVESICQIHQLAEKPVNKLGVVRKFQDLSRNQEQGIKSIILWFQDPHPIENKLELLRAYYMMGLRVCQLTYNKANYLGSGCTETADGGLTDFGRRAVQEMNKLGIVVDASHSSKKTALDAISQSVEPVIFSHANAHAITNSPRNKSDEEIRLVAENGGVIGLTSWGPLCWKKASRQQPSLDDYLDHVEYVVDLVGIDHVGFGSDNTIDLKPDKGGTQVQSDLYPSVVAEYNRDVGTDPSVRHAIGFKGVHEIDNVIEGLKDRGYDEKNIDQFLGGNFLRVFKQVWRD